MNIICYKFEARACELGRPGASQNNHLFPPAGETSSAAMGNQSRPDGLLVRTGDAHARGRIRLLG